VAAQVLAFVGLGANLGHAQAAVQTALRQLAALSQTQLQAHSRLYRSAPWQADGPDYINAVASLLTLLPAQSLLEELQKIEHLAGRQRPYVNAPRTLDLDLLIYGDAQIHTPTLTVPHPRLWQRAFVVLPLAEIAPERVSPAQLTAVQGQAISAL
jgi:2-amino-4-hydroxy-6-hydroxymethyldihydropteridine diphosphokinase